MYLKSHGKLNDSFSYRIYGDSEIQVWVTDGLHKHTSSGFAQKWDIVRNRPKGNWDFYRECKKTTKHTNWTPLEAVRWARKYVDYYHNKYEQLPKNTVRLLAEWILLCSQVTLFFGIENLKRASFI